MTRSRLPITHCLTYQIFSGKLSQIPLNSKLLINTINQYSYCIAEENELFKRSLKESDVLLPDGVGITTAINYLTGKKVNKIAGADLHLHLLKRLNEMGGKVFYLGSSEKTLAKIKFRLSLEYSNVRVETYSPPFKPTFSESDNEAMIDAVNAFQPDVLFVGMTAPKQEIWSFQNKERLNANLICSIGAVFDFYAGTIERPKQIWINLGLEWFMRLVKEPKRMSRRYLYYGPIFGSLLLKEKLATRKARREEVQAKNPAKMHGTKLEEQEELV